jgi:hypothetical protein
MFANGANGAVGLLYIVGVGVYGIGVYHIYQKIANVKCKT